MPNPSTLAALEAERTEWMREAIIAATRVAELEAENTRLRAQVESHCERIAAQAELLAKRAERDG